MMKTAFIKLIASGFYFGYSSIIPGTTGTFPAWLIAFLIIGNHPAAIIAGAIILTAVSIFISDRAEKIWEHDAKKIVIDEWAGMFITLIMIPFSLLNYILAFGSFRLLDAIKIFPARAAEKLPGGWGVTADDVVAGIQANILTQLLIYGYQQLLIYGILPAEWGL